MARRRTRRSSKKLKNHPLFISASTCSLKFRHNPRSETTDSCFTSEIICGKDVITGMHIVSLSGGQILKTRTITKLVREDQCLGVQAVQDCDTQVMCGISGNFKWENELSGSCSEVPSSAKESSQGWDFRRRIQMLFILQVLFQPRERHHDRLQTDLQIFREVQRKFLFNHLQDYCNLNLSKSEGGS